MIRIAPGGRRSGGSSTASTWSNPAWSTSRKWRPDKPVRLPFDPGAMACLVGVARKP
jgi:hypothetical protein